VNFSHFFEPASRRCGVDPFGLELCPSACWAIYHERHPPSSNFGAAGQPAVKLMRWGLIPSWAKDESVGNALINAQSETIESRTAFREAFKHRRCLIPADSFYEWKEMHGERQPFRVMLKSGEPFCFAGLWDRWVKPPAAGKFDTDLDEAPASETIESFTIITRAANAAVAPLHDRMPVIMAPCHFGWWLRTMKGAVNRTRWRWGIRWRSR